jgi:hypothetical protein
MDDEGKIKEQLFSNELRQQMAEIERKLTDQSQGGSA